MRKEAVINTIEILQKVVIEHGRTFRDMQNNYLRLIEENDPTKEDYFKSIVALVEEHEHTLEDLLGSLDQFTRGMSLSELFPDNTFIKEINLELNNHILFTSGVISKDKHIDFPIRTKRIYQAGEFTLASILAGSNPKEAIKQRVNAVWQTALQATLINAVMGSNPETIPTNVDILNETTFSEDRAVFIMHSTIFSKLKDYIIYKEREGSSIFNPFYKDTPVIVDDRLYTKGIKDRYHLYCLEKEAIKYIDIICEDNTKIAIDETIGVKPETLYTGKDMFLEVVGCSFLGKDVAEYGPTDQELSNPDNWEGKSNKIKAYSITL